MPKTCKEPKLLDYRTIGQFHRQIERYFDRFPADHIRIFDFDDWTQNPRAAYLEIMRLLEIEDDGRANFPPVNEAKSHRSQTLGRLIVNPPRWARNVVGVIKRILGLPTLHLAQTAMRFIAVPGYKTSVAPEIRGEIRRLYEQDNRCVRPRLWKPPP